MGTCRVSHHIFSPNSASPLFGDLILAMNAISNAECKMQLKITQRKASSRNVDSRGRFVQYKGEMSDYLITILPFSITTPLCAFSALRPVRS